MPFIPHALCYTIGQHSLTRGLRFVLDAYSLMSGLCFAGGYDGYFRHGHGGAASAASAAASSGNQSLLLLALFSASACHLPLISFSLNSSCPARAGLALFCALFTRTRDTSWH